MITFSNASAVEMRERIQLDTATRMFGEGYGVQRELRGMNRPLLGPFISIYTSPANILAVHKLSKMAYLRYRLANFG